MKKYPISPIIVVILFLGICFTPYFHTISFYENNVQSVRTSAPLGYTIHIDGNWSATAATYEWCTGSGSESDPYVIQDIEIDANGAYGILIGNTTDEFRIENVIIYNAGNGGANSSIVMDNVDNGHLLLNDFSDNAYCGVQMNYCNDFVVEYNTISDNGNRGMNIIYCANIAIQHNLLTGNSQYGINLYYSDVCNIWNNTFSGIGGQNYGIYVYHSDDNIIRENSFSHHNSAGIYLVVDLRTNVTYNDFTGNVNGISGLISTNTDITYNNMTGNSGSGIFFSACDNMWVEGNRLINNRYGFNVGINSDFNTLTQNIFQDNTEYGVRFPYDEDYNNTNHLFYKNSFISNPIHALDNSIDTKWNNSEYGNFWDTYSGLDENLDGIVDSPYVIDANITDYRPLIVSNFSLLDDNDLDGLSDYAEINGGLNSFGAEPTEPYNADSDEDGLTDGEEVTGSENAFDGNPTDPNESDTDGDGYTDMDEVTGVANTYDGSPIDPNNRDSDGDLINDNNEIPLIFDPLNQWEYPKPDLVILPNYTLDGEVISFTVKNLGKWRATGVVVIVNISSEELTLYNNTLTRFNLDVNQTKEIKILKAEYRHELTEGANYFLSIYVDPTFTVNETNEENNSEEDILYTHTLSAIGLTGLQLALIIASSAIVILAAAVGSYLLLKYRKQKIEFRPLQLMVLEKNTSLLLYSHKFEKNRNLKDEKKRIQNDDENKSNDEEESIDLRKNGTNKVTNKVVKEEPKKDIDEVLAAGAFSGIQSLLKSILRTEKGINEISHGEYTIYFNYCNKIICVLITYGKYHRILNTLKLFSVSFEEVFQNELAEFDGRVDMFSRAHQIVEKYFIH